ncbi:MAG: heterodisulfide reductase-related iron-sulfur binding cluster [Acidobacteriota bacterium]|jgi:glycerol-3-phosphate dehydrogenase subunit C
MDESKGSGGLGGLNEFVFDVHGEGFYDEPALEAEERRIFEVCNGCRLCYNLCPSFNILFERLDEPGVDGDAEKLTGADLSAVSDACYYCKLCYPKCPYTPPHEYKLDFPHLAMRRKALNYKKHGASRGARMLSDPAAMARRARPAAPLVNALNRFRPARKLMAGMIGIHPDAALPPVASKPFSRRLAGLPRPTRSKEKAVLFTTCLVEGHYPEIGEALVRFLAACGVEVVVPKEQGCCGIPHYDTGDLGAAVEKARRNVEVLYPYAKEGLPILAPVSTCAMGLATEYPLLVPGEESARVAEATRDLFDYLADLKKSGLWPAGEPASLGQVLYHVPCHLKSMARGFKGKDLLAQLPETTVKLADGCSGHDGTYGIRTETYEDSLKVGRKLFRKVEKAEGIVASECPLSCLQIGHATGSKPVHPVILLARAYGLLA